MALAAQGAGISRPLQAAAAEARDQMIQALADQGVTGTYPDSFTTPVPVVPGQEYVASYTAYLGEYQATENFFPATVVHAPFVLPAQAGVFSYDNGFPTQTWKDSYYWVTPVFQP